MKKYIAPLIAAVLLTGVVAQQAISYTKKSTVHQLANQTPVVAPAPTVEKSLPDHTDQELRETKAWRQEVAPIQDPKTGKIAYLTFDDGPSVENTPRVLDTLRRERIHGTFFVNAKSDSDSLNLMKRAVTEGNAIGNHTLTHNYAKIYRNVEAFCADFAENEDLIERATGVRTKIMRFPGGSNNGVSAQYGGQGIMPKIAAEMKRQGYVYFDWNVSSGDAAGTEVPSQRIIENVLSQAQGKEKVIVLMHDSSVKKTSAEALPTIIQGLRQQGFSFAKLEADSYSYQFL